MDGLELVIVKNPFDRSQRETRVTSYTQQSVQTLILSELPLGINYHVSINGQLIEASSWGVTYPCHGDQLTVVVAVHGGGGGKNILRTVLMITLAVVASAIPGMQPFAGTMFAQGLGAAALSAGTMIVGGMLINALVPPPQVSLAGAEDFESSPSYSWSPQLTQQQGLIVPKWYGEIRAYSSNIIASHLESVGEDQYINALLSFGYGPIESITDVYINDQPIDNYDDIGLQRYERRGWIDQEVVPNFGDTKVEDVRNLLLSSTASETYTTGVAGTDFDSLELEFECPAGLWYANDKGGMDRYEVRLTVEMRKSGTGDSFITLSETATSEIYYWPGYDHWEYGSWISVYRSSSEGEGVTTARWYRKGDGSVQIEDHVEGASAGSHRVWHWVDVGRNIADAVINQIVLNSNKTNPLRRVLKVHSSLLEPGFAYDIVMTKTTTDRDTDPKYGEELRLSIVREVEETDFQYPRSVLYGLRALGTDQLSGSLNVSVHGRWAIVNTWNGTSWTLQWSNNPAWVCYDILSQPVISGNSLATYAVERYDGIDPSRLDHAKFLEWADYCDELVLGMDGTEPRSRFDGCFDTETSMWEAALLVCESGRAMLLWNGTAISVHVDKPASPVQLFSMGNILLDSFSEQFLAQADRISEIDIDFTNVENSYLRDKINIINPLITNTSNKTSMALKGVTRYSEAYRLAMLKLNYNKVITRTMNWSASIDALACQIGDVVYLQHDVPQWGTGGRVVSNIIDTNQVILDQEVEIDAVSAYVLTIRHNDDTITTYSVTTTNQTTAQLSLSSTIAVDISLCSYAFGKLLQDKKPVRIIGLSRGQEQQIDITAIDYNDTVYNIDTNTPVVDTHNYSDIDNSAAVTALAVTDNLILINETVNTQVILTWQNNENVKECEVWVSVGGGDIAMVGKYLNIYYDNNATDNVTYVFYVVPINYFNHKDLLVNSKSVSHLTVGKLAAPEDVTLHAAVLEKYGIRLSWEPNTELDFSHFKLSVGTDYATSTLLTTLTSTDWLWEIRAAGTYTIWAVAYDSGLRVSDNPTSIECIISNPDAVVLSNSINGENVVLSWSEVAGDFAIEYYEIRNGTNWDDVDAVAGSTTVKGTSYSTKVLNAMNVTWWVAAVDVAGNIGSPSSTAMSINFPGIINNFNAQVIDNYALLRFEPPVSGTLPIDRYEFRKGLVFSSATSMGTTRGTFNTIFETEANQYVYWVAAIDSADNYGTEVSLNVTINEPPDFILRGDYDSAFSGAKTNALVYDTNVKDAVELERWEFTSSSDGWLFNAITPTNNATSLTITATGVPPFMHKTIDSYAGGTYFIIKMRVKRLAGTGWSGQVNYANSHHGFDSSYIALVPDQDLSDFVVLEWDMRELAAGGNDYTANSITALAFTLGVTAGDNFEVDWISIGDAGGVSKLLLPIDTTETFQEHFVDNSFVSPDAQVVAGYPLYIQPAESTAQYIEEFDYGTLVPSTKVTVGVTFDTIVAGVTCVPTIELAGDDQVYDNGSIVGSYELFGSNFRYVRVTLDWTGTDTSLICVSNINIRLDIKIKNDGGSGTALAADTGGTDVHFSEGVNFLDVDSLIVTPKYNASYPVTAVYDFLDEPNPIAFQVYLFRTDTGVRVDGDFSWVAKGY